MIKLFRENITNWFADWYFKRPIFFTGVLNNNYGYGDGELNNEMIRKNNKHFLNDLHRKVYKKSKKKLKRLVVIEKGQIRKHCHIVLDIPEHLSCYDFIHLVYKSWLKTKGGISIDISPVYDIKGLNQYLSKEIYPNSELGVDIQNSYKTI
mgnify:CR=1 FL=1